MQKKGRSMFQRVLTFALILGIVAGAAIFTADNVQAQAPVGGAPAAKDANWVIAVTYQNTGTSATPVIVNFYAEGSDIPTMYDPRTGKGDLAVGAADSFFIGNVSDLSSGFQGSATMSATSAMAATSVQFSNDTYVYTGGQQPYKMRLLSNAFSANDVSDQFLVATALLNKFSRTTVFSIQSTGSDEITVTIKFYDADASGNLASTMTFDIPANSSKWIDMADTADTGLTGRTQFNGSAIITAVKKGTTTASDVVASAGEYYTDRPVATAFEGMPLGSAAQKIYLATALCERFGLDTFYAVQNASLTDPATITVTYKNLDGTTKAVDGPYTIGSGQKKSIRTCAPNDGTNMANFSGAATIDVATGGAPIVAIGKAQVSNGAGAVATADVLTAFLGQAQGYSKLAAPYVRWASETNYTSPSNTGGKQRAFIAVQNLESTEIKVNARYNDRNGNTVATEVLTISANSKGNTNPSNAGALGQSGMNVDEFGYYTDGGFGGGVILEAHPDTPTATFIAIARVQIPGSGEDYNLVPVQ